MVFGGVEGGARTSAAEWSAPVGFPRTKIGPESGLSTEQKALVARHLWLVGLHIRHRVRTPASPMMYREYEDLFQTGCLALIRAALRFRPEGGVSFAAYALPRIRGTIHKALYTYFGCIRIPYRVQRQFDRSPTTARPFRRQPLTRAEARLTVRMNLNEQPDCDRIRHVLRDRFRRAVQDGLVRLSHRRWRRSNSMELLERIADERLLVESAHRRTPLRQIAREMSVSSGRASDYARHLREAVAEALSRDVQIPLLLAFAAEDGEGFDGWVDADRRARLVGAEVEAFERRFAALPALEKAQLFYSLVEQSPGAVPRIACRLFRRSIKREMKLS